MKKLNLLLITILSVGTVSAEVMASTETTQYIRAAFWVFTLIISLTGIFIIVRRRDKQEDRIEF